MRAGWATVVAASLLLATALSLIASSQSPGPDDLYPTQRPADPATASPPGDASSGPSDTASRPYVTAVGTSAVPPPNCDQAVDAAPAVDAACFQLPRWYDTTATVRVDDASGQPIFARAVFRDSGGTHLATYRFCGQATWEVPIWSAQLTVWVQPAWAGALNEVDGMLQGNRLPCEEQAGTRGTVHLGLR